MRDRIEARLRQLQQERTQVAGQLQQLAQQLEQARATIAAYDGAIGELAALLQGDTATGDAPTGDAAATGEAFTE